MTIIGFRKDIEDIWKEFDQDFYRMAEEIIELREQLEEKQEEIDEHVCETSE